MENLSAVLNMMTQDCYMAISDLEDAYYIVPVLCIDQKHLLFQFKDNLCNYIFLLDALTSASVFPALRKEGYQITDYLDDTS